MLALVVDDGPRIVLDYPEPSIGPDEALVRVHLAGVCATDLELVRGYRGFVGVPGHEFVGSVIGPDGNGWVGQRVVGEINVGCGRCTFCRKGIPSQCPARTALGILGRDGAFAEYLILPVANLHPVPDDVPDQVAVFTELLAAALQVSDLAHVHPSDRVGVLGDGKLGLIVAQALATGGAKVMVIGRHPSRLALAEGWGMMASMEPAHDALDLVVDCTGHPSGFADALAYVRPRGTVVLKSTYCGSAVVDLTKVVVDEIRLVGSRCGPFRPALRLLQSGQIDVTSLIEARFPLMEGLEALDRAAERGALKVLIEP